MYSSKSISIDINQVIFQLFCLYAFSMPFELVLEKLFYIDTIFKPFRVLSLCIAGMYLIKVFKNNLTLSPREGADIFLYLVFVYGILISFIKIISSVFQLSIFYNDLFLIGLHLITFFIYKSMDFNKKEALKLLQYFVAGILINGVYLLYNLLLKIQYGRQSGFIDNPNYAALGFAAVIIYFLLQLNFNQQIKTRVFYFTGIAFLLYVFIITGSRAGLIVLLTGFILAFIFSTLRRKIGLLFISGLLLFTLYSRTTDYAYFGGSLVLINRITEKVKDDVEDVRFVIWRGVFRLLEDEGYCGMGIGQFKAKFPKYYGEESNKLVLEIVNRGYHLSTHNDYLALLTDYGLPGLLFYLLFLGVTLKKKLKALAFASDEKSRFLTQFNFIVLISLIVFGMAAENFQHQLYWFLLMFSSKEY